MKALKVGRVQGGLPPTIHHHHHLIGAARHTKIKGNTTYKKNNCED
jgi:hypothetical protein